MNAVALHQQDYRVVIEDVIQRRLLEQHHHSRLLHILLANLSIA
jgi:hypothetical protein